MFRLLLVLMFLSQTAFAQVTTAMWDQEVSTEEFLRQMAPQNRQIQSHQYHYVDPTFLELLTETEETILGQSLQNYPIEDRLTVLEQYLHMPISYGTNPKVRLEQILRTAVNIAQRVQQQRQSYISQQPVYIPQQPRYNQQYNYSRPSYDPGRYGDPYDYRGANNNSLNTFIQVFPYILDLFRRQRY